MSFSCIHCHKEVSEKALGTQHRNHCPYCLWSQHLDNLPGDRSADCGGAMRPLGLSFKNDGGQIGELMVVHKCQKCGVESKNRLAGDDEASAIVGVFEESLDNHPESSFKLLAEADRREIITQVFGKAYADEHLPK